VPSSATILLVHPDRRRRAAVASAIRRDDHRVLVAGDGPAALRTLATDAVDAVVLRLDLPAALGGLDVCRRLRRLGGATPGVLALEPSGRVADRVRALDAGADDCLSEPCDVAELAARLRALTRRARLDRTAAERRRVVRYAGVEVDLPARTATHAGRPLDLTPTELDLLAHLVTRPGKVLSHTDLLLAVWGYPADATTNTLRVYMGYLRRKLEAGGEPRLLHTVRGAGYVMRTR
jgi:DNA-binding response OmpR family regulator